MISLVKICGSERRRKLAKLESYYDGCQYDHLEHDWDGYASSSSGRWGIRALANGYFVPLSERRPSVRAQIPKLIVRRYTDFLLGRGRFPDISSPDERTNDFLRELIVDSRLRVRMRESRNIGGASGTAVLSFSFVKGKPRISVHRPSQVDVLSWYDKDELIPSSVIKAYEYTGDKGERLYFARIWTETEEILYEAIPEKIAREDNWDRLATSVSIVHDYGACPVCWIQNSPISGEVDGESDYDGITGNAEEFDRVTSATVRGTQANVDPTLLIKSDPNRYPDGDIKKGSSNALIAPDAEYLELSGTAVSTALELKRDLKQEMLDVTGVVLSDPSTGIRAQSAAALKMLYQPMVAHTDDLRDQYGDGIDRLLTGMIRAAKKISSGAQGDVIRLSDGRLVQNRPSVLLYDVDGELLSPGDSDRVEIRWPDYFPATASDVRQSSEATNSSIGQTISRKTGVRYMAGHFGVENIDAELEEIARERSEDADRYGFGAAPPAVAGAQMTDDDEIEIEIDDDDDDVNEEV